MHYGVFSDIHGNFKALEAVWHALTALGLTDGRPVLNAGDNVGYGDSPEACIQFLQSHSEIYTVQGNYDRNVARFPEREADYRRKWGRARPDKFEALRRDSAAISELSRQWLLALPEERDVTLENVRLLLTHYAPGGRHGLGRWTTDTALAIYAAQTSTDVVVCGHTHCPFVRRAGGILFVNPGTVGRAFFGGPAFAILTLTPNQPPSAQLRQVKL